MSLCMPLMSMRASFPVEGPAGMQPEHALPKTGFIQPEIARFPRPNGASSRRCIPFSVPVIVTFSRLSPRDSWPSRPDETGAARLACTAVTVCTARRSCPANSSPRASSATHRVIIASLDLRGRGQQRCDRAQQPTCGCGCVCVYMVNSINPRCEQPSANSRLWTTVEARGIVRDDDSIRVKNVGVGIRGNARGSASALLRLEVRIHLSRPRGAGDAQVSQVVGQRLRGSCQEVALLRLCPTLCVGRPLHRRRGGQQPQERERCRRRRGRMKVQQRYLAAWIRSVSTVANVPSPSSKVQHQMPADSRRLCALSSGLRQTAESAS